MKKITATTIAALMSFSALSADFRDTSLKGSTDVSNGILEVGESSVEATVDVAVFTAEELKAFVMKHFASSVDASVKVSDAVVDLLEVSEPVFNLTKKGLELIFEISKDGLVASSEATDKIIILLEPSSEASLEVTEKVLVEVFDVTSQGSELSTEVVEWIYENFKEPIDMSFRATGKVFELTAEGSEVSSEVVEVIIGSDNLEAGTETTGEGIALTSQGISAVFMFISAGTSAASDFIGLYRDEVEQAIEREDEATIQGLRDMIRAEINQNIKGGQTLNKLLSDKDLDLYIQAHLELAK